jgi:hypothetical protein
MDLQRGLIDFRNGRDIHHVEFCPRENRIPFLRLQVKAVLGQKYRKTPIDLQKQLQV